MENNEEPPQKKKRGPYKLYLISPKDKPVPESTIRSRNKREAQRNEEQRETDNQDNNDGSVDDEGLQVSANDETSESDIDQPQFEGMRHYNDQTDSFDRNVNHSEEDTNNPGNTMVGNENFTQEDCDQGIDYVKKYDLNRKMHRDFPLSILDVLLMVLHLSIRHCHTEQFVQDMISFVNVLFGETVLDISYHVFKNLFPSSKNIIRHYFCSDCEVSVGSTNELIGLKEKICSQCSKVVSVNSVDSGNYFITLSLKEQIEALLSRPDVKLVDRGNRTPSYISDIFDGSIYDRCKQLGIDIKNVLTYTLNTDGVRVHDSTKNTMWPILVYINEIVPEQRLQVDKVLLAGIWFGSSAPNMALFMKPFLLQALDLAEKGVSVTNFDGVIETFHVLPLVCSLDSVAKAKVLCQKQFNGHCGCLYCLHPNDGTVEGSRSKYYDTSVSYPLRTEEQVIIDMFEADKQDREGTLQDTVNGFFGISILLTFSKLVDKFSVNTFNIVWSVIIDYMHCVLEGVTSDLLQLYSNILNSAQLETLNERIKKIRPPEAMSRKPRPLSGKAEKLHWKAREYRQFLLYYALPCLEDLLPARNFRHLALLVNAMHILLSKNITLQCFSEAKNALSKFVIQFQSLYGLANVTYNLHLLTHLCDVVLRNGPLWCYSNFVFESCNGRLVRLIKGTRSIINEIALKFTKLHNVPGIIARNPISMAALEFCNQILGFKYVKNGIQMGAAFVTGSFSLIEVSDQEGVLLEENHVSVNNGQVKFFNRVISKGIVYCSSSYSKAKVFNDSCVKLANGQYALIDKILVSTTGKLLCLVSPIRISGHIIPPILRCAQDCFSDVKIIPFEGISQKCVFISFENKSFVCNIPNPFEHD